VPVLATVCWATAGCIDADPGEGLGNWIPFDTDHDGLADEFELEIGTDPSSEDSDGDSFADGEEWELYSDPLDVEDYPYEGGWEHFPFPSELAGEGCAAGDIATDFAGMDQYGQKVGLYTFYGNVIQLVSGAYW